jgi:hypothetical protein
MEVEEDVYDMRMIVPAYRGSIVPLNTLKPIHEDRL